MGLHLRIEGSSYTDMPSNRAIWAGFALIASLDKEAAENTATAVCGCRCTRITTSVAHPGKGLVVA